MSSPARVDWRDPIRGIPLAAITENGIKRISEGKDLEAQSAIERLSDRPNVARPGAMK